MGTGLVLRRKTAEGAAVLGSEAWFLGVRRTVGLQK